MPKFDTAAAYRNVPNNDTLPEIILQDYPFALKRYTAIKERAETAHAIMDRYNNEQTVARESQEEAESRLGHWIRDHQRSGSTMPEGSKEALEAEVNLYKAKRKRPLTGKILLPFMDQIDRFVQNHRGEFIMADIPQLAEFDADEGALESATAATKARRKELGVAEQAPRPPDWSKGEVAAELGALFKIGQPGLDGIQFPVDISERTGRFQIANSNAGIDWPRQYFRPGDEAQTVNTLALFVWLHHDAIRDKLFAQIDARKNAGMSPDEKTAQVLAKHAEIATALRLEDAILCALEAKGNLTLRKSHYHPSVLLGVEISRVSLIAEYQ
jgi:hypothetical protein